MADDCDLRKRAPSEPEADSAAADALATPQQWASMTFAPMVIDENQFGPGWDQSRGAIARAAIALLRFDDESLTRHFLSGPEPLRRALDEHAGLLQEIAYLKTHIEALETAATRVLCAVLVAPSRNGNVRCAPTSAEAVGEWPPSRNASYWSHPRVIERVPDSPRFRAQGMHIIGISMIRRPERIVRKHSLPESSPKPVRHF